MTLVAFVPDCNKHEEVILLKKGTNVRMRGGYRVVADARKKAVRSFFRHEDEIGWGDDEETAFEKAEAWADENGHELTT